MYRWLLLVSLIIEPALAGPVQWLHMPKMNPWNFESDQRPQNHANIDPAVYREWVEASTPDLRPIDRIRRAAQKIHELTVRPRFLKAVLLRDVIDMVQKLHPTFSSTDQQAENGIVFIGRNLDSNKRFALAFSYEEPLFYSGLYSCEMAMQDLPTLNFRDTQTWRPLFPETGGQP